VTNPDQKIIFKQELVLFMQNEKAQGALKHSGVIIPIEHRETVFDMTEAEIIATFKLLLDVKRWMNDNFSPDGYNVGWNCGKVGGQEVLHAHMHVIPRFQQEPLAGAGIRTLLKSDANKW
jgi:histidine triad (HIT) family protein